MARSDKGGSTTRNASPAGGSRTGRGTKSAGGAASDAERSARTTDRSAKAAAPAARGKGDTKPSKEQKQAAKDLKKEQRRGRFGRRLLKIGFLRRRYIKRIMRNIEKSKEKGKRMPPELWDLSKRLDRLPPGKRVEFLEQAITAGPEAQEQAGRAMRRAAASQERMSGRGGGRYRPGMGPMPPGARRGKPR